MSETLARLAQHVGIIPAYHDFHGVERCARDDTIRAALAAMGFATDDAAVADQLHALETERTARALPRDCVVTAHQAIRLELHHAHTVEWTLQQPDGTTLTGHGAHAIDLPPLAPDVYRLRVGAFETTVIAAPDHAPSLKDVTGRDKVWGVLAAITALQSDRNTGAGDLADLQHLITTLAQSGAAFCGLNPVNALSVSPDAYSPYSPSTRSFLNPRLIAFDKVPEFEFSAEARAIALAKNAEFDALRGLEHIDHRGAALASEPILKAIFATFETLDRTAPRQQAFDAFLAARGPELGTFALFEALSEHHGVDWRAWPTALQSCTSAETLSFAAANQSAQRYHAYLQWLADTQLGGAHTVGKANGMGLGLYADMAVGVQPGGG